MYSWGDKGSAFHFHCQGHILSLNEYSQAKQTIMSLVVYSEDKKVTFLLSRRHLKKEDPPAAVIYNDLGNPGKNSPKKNQSTKGHTPWKVQYRLLHRGNLTAGRKSISIMYNHHHQYHEHDHIIGWGLFLRSKIFFIYYRHIQDYHLGRRKVEVYRVPSLRPSWYGFLSSLKADYK